MYLIDWVQEWAKIETISTYIGYGLLGLGLLFGIIYVIICLIQG